MYIEGEQVIYLPMLISQNHYTKVLKFWRSIETFTLPDIPAKKKDQKIHTELKAGNDLPWEPGKLPLKDGKRWKHTLYFNVVPKEAVVSLLARLSGSTEFREPVSGLTCLSALVLDYMGQPADQTYCPAAFIYGIKILREKVDPEELEGMLKKAQEDYLLRFQIVKEQQEEEEQESELNMVDWNVLQKELNILQGLTRNELKPQTPVLCISEAVTPTEKLEAPFLNSYYFNDLNTLINHPNDIGVPMEIFLSEEPNINLRYNLLDPQALLDSIHPRNQSPGRWPSNPTYGLYSAQQATLNLAIPDLRQHSGLLGINGPPGTGKTTLLREVIADVVVNRAKRLSKVKASTLFASKWHRIVDRTGYYKIDNTVLGNDGIVVSSNNNAAIENISKELPVMKSVDRQVFEEADYFSSIATSIQGEPCWGMMSAVLGNSKNRSKFVNDFWFKKDNNFNKYLRDQYSDPGQIKKNEENYEETARELKVLLDEYESFSILVTEYHDLLSDMLLKESSSVQWRVKLQELGSKLKVDYDIKSTNLPDLSFLEFSLEKIHQLTPYSSEKINILRSRIFLLSLELHEWAIRTNARYFYNNLNAYVNMLSNKLKEDINEEIAADLWGSFFFCVPVVSVTLASFQRQFTKMEQGTIGWLLVDEAGQATPPSVCGAIWRSKRCIIIGDTQQIPPVVTIPKGLGKLLQNAYGINDDCWSPIYHSAQFLADRVTLSGTYIALDDGIDTWTGLPLRAHRRCNEPMFSISNSIAYNGQMVRVTQGTSGDSPVGVSGWVDVSGITSSEGHIIIEELQVLGDLLTQLAYFEGKIYVISPFRSIADECREQFDKKDRIECGTIHTFQGKEAEIVFLILGTQAGAIGARDWVADTPNMLNVAVTRAKERLYVIGNRRLWANHRYFDQLADRLPIKEHFSGRLF